MSKTYLVPLRTTPCDENPAGLIDVRRCTQLTSRVDRDQGGIFEWKHVLLSPAGRFLVYSFVQKPEPPYEEMKKYAVFITEMEAIVWFADYPEFAPECMRPLFSKFDLTEAADRIELPAPSENGTAAPKGRDIKALHPNLPVDDLAVAAWTRLTKENGQPPSITRVASEIGRNRRHLYRCRHFMSLVATEKRDRDKREHCLPRGWKGPSGLVEARQDED
jgi:hypothetical protein